MRGYIANTDFDWYEFLLRQRNVDEVNFWRPSAVTQFHSLKPGEPFFFKLKKPHYAIAGFGLFTRYHVLPAWLAWDTFDIANGAATFEAMCARIEKYREARPHDVRGKYDIGCLVIGKPVFFPKGQWVDQPRDWHKNVVQGETYDLTTGEGHRVFRECLTRTSDEATAASAGAADLLESVGPSRFGKPHEIRPRLGQGAFRLAVTEAYGRACAVSGEHSLPALEAAHIRPYTEDGEHSVTNGLLLRSDIHRLFDKGYVTVTPSFTFRVSRRLRDEFANGRTYYPLDGRRIALPPQQEDRPDPALLSWHHDVKFMS